MIKLLEVIRLLNQYENVEILERRPTGKRACRGWKDVKANEFKADIFISNHHTLEFWVKRGTSSI